MGFLDMIRPALDRITSSNSYGFITRVLTFTGSFNERTSLLVLGVRDAELEPTQQTEEAAAPQAPAAPPAASSATTAAHPFDMEAATPLAAPDDAAEWRRVGKSVQTVCVFAASSSLVLFVNLPSNKPGAAAATPGQHGGGGALYSAGMVFIGLGFFSSLGLSMFSIVARPGEAAVARTQKWGMVVAVASVFVAFSLRMCMMLVA